MLKKLKKTILLVAGISLLAFSVASCKHGNTQAPDGSDPVSNTTKEFTQPDLDSLASQTNNDWAYVTYPLSEFVGKEVIINISCEMKVENPDGEKFDDTNEETKKNPAGYLLKWHVNDGSTYPLITSHLFTPDETEWVKVEGKNATPIKIASGNVLYLSTNNKGLPKLKVSVRNIKYTITYGGKEEEKPEAKVYPTDIFTVGAAGSCGIVLRDGDKEAFTVFADGSAASDIKTEADGSVSWIATAAGGGGGGVAFYVKANKEEINFANYDSIDIELVYSPVTGAWNPKAQKPGFCLRVLPYDSTGIFGGYEDLEYFDGTEEYGTLTKNFKISDAFTQQIVKSCDFDSVLGFAIKFNDYNRGNTDGDQLKVQLKNVKFNAKANATADKPFDDGLTAAQHGTVYSIEYPTRDWSVDADKVTNADKYNKHGWVYLPAGYDATDTTTKYPVFILLHGFGQNENTWGMSDKGRGGRIKGFMDRGMAKGDVEKFILVCVTGVADKSWGPNGSGNSFTGYNCFGGELRNDLLPYLRKTYNIADGRDNVAIAGLSMGGGQTFNIGIGQCLDLISNFAGFSGALFTQPEAFKNEVKEKFDSSLKIQNLYMICGDNDSTVYFGNKEMGTPSYIEYVNALKDWDRVENFESYVYPGGTHDFPVWFKGFKDFIHMVFQEGVQLYKD